MRFLDARDDYAAVSQDPRRTLYINYALQGEIPSDQLVDQAKGYVRIQHFYVFLTMFAAKHLKLVIAREGAHSKIQLQVGLHSIVHKRGPESRDSV